MALVAVSDIKITVINKAGEFVTILTNGKA